jgi:hypothetical protein
VVTGRFECLCTHTHTHAHAHTHRRLCTRVGDTRCAMCSLRWSYLGHCTKTSPVFSWKTRYNGIHLAVHLVSASQCMACARTKITGASCAEHALPGQNVQLTHKKVLRSCSYYCLRVAESNMPRCCTLRLYLCLFMYRLCKRPCWIPLPHQFCKRASMYSIGFLD